MLFLLCNATVHATDASIPPSFAFHSITDKTLHETYLPSFAEGVRAGSGSVMASYNSINGTHACEHDQALNTILKRELNFQGWVMSE